MKNLSLICSFVFLVMGSMSTASATCAPGASVTICSGSAVCKCVSADEGLDSFEATKDGKCPGEQCSGTTAGRDRCQAARDIGGFSANAVETDDGTCCTVRNVVRCEEAPVFEY